MKRNDFVLIIICAVIGILGLGFHYGVQRQGAYVTVSVDGEVIKTLSLSENQSYEIYTYCIKYVGCQYYQDPYNSRKEHSLRSARRSPSDKLITR